MDFDSGGLRPPVICCVQRNMSQPQLHSATELRRPVILFLISGTALAMALLAGARGGPANSAPEIAASDYTWVQAIAPGRGQWPEACGPQSKGMDPAARKRVGACTPGYWPKASMPVTAFAGRLWMPQHSHTAWHSADGIAWQQQASRGGWGERYGAAVVFFKEKIWLLGGSTGDWVYQNDIWTSRNGTDWSPATARAPWRPRRWHCVVVFRDKLWLLGGNSMVRVDGTGGEQFNDVWVSEDGGHWSQVTQRAPWTAGGWSAVVFQDRLWLLGDGKRNEIWSSPDGVAWERVAETASWRARNGFGTAVFDGKLWIFGGGDAAGPRNDVWATANGVHWEQVFAQAPWGRRMATYHVVFQDKVWIFGGKEGGRIGFYDDVWHLARRARRTQNHAAPEGVVPKAQRTGLDHGNHHLEMRAQVARAESADHTQ